MMKWFLWLGPDLVVLGVFSALLAVFASTHESHFTFLQGTFILPLACLAGFTGLSYVAHLGYKVLKKTSRRFPRPGEIVRDWMPFILVAFVYENLHEFTHVLNRGTVDAGLRALDRMMFGTDVALILERFTVPWLTEYMTFAYALYFVFPTIIFAILYARQEREKFHEFTWAVSLSFYLGFLGYVTVPAIGPRFFMSGEFTVPLQGIFITERAAAAWNSMERVQKDCFPSLHTALSTICLIYFWRYRNSFTYGKILWRVCTPLIVSLWVSTLYLRYHWFVDVMAGWVTAYGCCWIAPRFTKWYYARVTGREPQVSTDMA